ncbi:MAG: AsmA family protein [Granulosicoccus sp.]
MKVLKWVLIVCGVLMLVVGIGIAALVYLVDWNDFKDTIQNQVKKQTGRELTIAGDLNPSVFPWAGISIGEITLANAEGFGDQPFARISSADVKVKLLPLLKKSINIRTVELNGLQVDLQRATDGSTNWDDLVDSTSTTTTTSDGSGTDTEVTTEVEGSTATIAALEVGGIQISDANVSWKDAQAGTDARLTGFNLETGAIELAEPFDLSTSFAIASESMGLQADIDGSGRITLDLQEQVYSLKGFKLKTTARGDSLPGGKLSVVLGANVQALLGEQTINLNKMSLESLGVALKGNVKVTDLDTAPTVAGKLSSNTFSPKELFSKLGIEAPVTADEKVLSKASLSVTLAATPASAALDDLIIKLDETTFTGKAGVPSLAGAVPPLRFEFAVDAIDIDRYLPPVDAAAETAEESTDAETPVASDSDTPIELPLDLLRQLDVDGTFSVGSVKVSNLTTSDIVIPLKAKGGVLALDGIKAALYEGNIDATARLDATKDIPGYGVQFSLAGIQAEPLLADLMQKDSFLSGGGDISLDITTSGHSVNAIKAGLIGGFNTAFTDGSINGINLGYQIRRAKAALSGKTMANEEKNVKTDFSSLTVSGNFSNGVMTSTDLDMRSPLLRVSGAGKVDLPAEQVDYTMTTLVTGTSKGQGGDDLAGLKGVKLDIPIRGSFDELAANFAGVILSGMKDNITGNLKNQAKALADEEAAKLKAQAQEQLDAQKAEAQKALDAKKAEAQKKADELKNQAKDKAKDKLKGLLGN